MLVLTRAKGEALVISHDIVVEVVEISGDKVRLGIMCPKEVPVHRHEIWAAIQRSTPVALPVVGDES